MTADFACPCAQDGDRAGQMPSSALRPSLETFNTKGLARRAEQPRYLSEMTGEIDSSTRAKVIEIVVLPVESKSLRPVSRTFAAYAGIKS